VNLVGFGLLGDLGFNQVGLVDVDRATKSFRW
jgi:hypothetical protein